VAYSGLGELDTAVVCYEQSLQIAKETGNQLGVGIRLSNLGSVYSRKGDPQKGLDYFRQAADTLKKVKNKKELAKVLFNIGLIYERLGKPRQALGNYEEAAKNAKSIPLPDLEAFPVGNLVKLHGQLGNIEKSLFYSQRLLEIRTAMKDSAGICQALNALGVRHGELGNYREAEGYYKQAMDIAQKRKDQGGLLSTYINLGSLYQAVSDYAKALDAYFKALKIAQATRVAEAERVCYNNIGVTYTDLGEEENALSYHEKALRLSEKMKDKQGIANSKLNMGAIYLEWEKLSERDRYQRAKQCFEEALDTCRELGNKRVAAMSLMNIASIYKRQGECTKALEVFELALAIQDTIGDKPTKGVCIYNIAEVYKDIKNDSAALVNLQKALSIAIEVGNPGDIWQAQHEIGLILEKQGKSKEALQYYTQAIDNIESIRSRLQLESFKTSFMEDKVAVYESAVNLLVKMGRYKEAFAYSEKAKARALLDILSLGTIDVTKGISRKLHNQKKTLERKLVKIQDDLRDERTKRAEEQSKTHIASLENQLTKTRNQYQTLLQEIQIRHPRYGQLTGIREPLKVREVQQRILSPETIVIEYFVAKNHTVVWVLKKNALHCERIPVKREQLERMVDSLRQPFREIKEGKIKNLPQVGFDLALSQKLYKQLFQPIEKYLVANCRLIIIPDGVLHYLPFEAMVTGIEAREHDPKIIFSEYENVHYLVERYAISYSPSASILDPKLRKKEKMTPEGKLLAFGNPDFGKFSQKGFGAVMDTTAESLRLNIASGGRIPEVLSPLPKSEEEIDGIASIMQPSLTYKGANAKEKYFKQKAGGYPFLHLSSHGFADENQPMYSYIVFAQDGDPKEDGFLYAYEVFNLKLNAELVTLSACETGLGKLSRGEGLMGLTRAFLYAGTPSLLVSLWSVDESTSRIMQYFYQNLKNGMAKAEALRQAKVKLIKTREGGISFSHPFLWAPFVLVGEGR